MSEQPETITTVVTKREDSIDRSTTLITAGDLPNIRVEVMHWAQILLYRAMRAFWVSWSGFVGTVYAAKVTLGPEIAAVMPDEVLDIVILAARVSVFPVVMSIATNGSELFAKLDEKFPKLRA